MSKDPLAIILFIKVDLVHAFACVLIDDDGEWVANYLNEATIGRGGKWRQRRYVGRAPKPEETGKITLPCPCEKNPKNRKHHLFAVSF